MISAKILVVEDERIVALHLKQQLSRLGYKVPAIATAGAQALKQIEELRPDVVLMDIHIEGDIDGIETASRIPREWQIPVIYLTAYSEEATLERARATMPYGYLLKPFSERELHAAIQMILERRRADLLLRQSEQRLEQEVADRTADLVQANRELEQQTAERLQAEQALHQAQKMEAVGRLTGGVAHDFNNSLTVIIGNLDTIQRSGELKKPNLHRALGSATRAAERAATLTQHLLAFSRLQPLDPTPIDLNQLVTGLSDMLSRTLGESIALEAVLAGGLWLVSADRNQLETAILNLVLNARDAMPEGGKLTIETANVHLDENYTAATPELTPGQYGMVAISDNGTGMAPDTLNSAFDPFFTTKDFGEGTGLGLSQVFGFVKQSGGHVKLYSELGDGTTVKLYLPRLAAADLPMASPEAATDVNRAKPGETILVVEDNDEVRSFSVSALEELGYQVISAPNGHVALRLLKERSDITLLFTDIGLPGGMNGRQVADQVSKSNPCLPILFTTGYARNALVHNGKLDQGLNLLAKPFTFTALAAKIRAVLDG